ncbi:MAG: hemerythrin family protein [Candidatus Competibacteraceae bacterium]|uniref:Bacteriohemerythrin n=1 Tax=Candidatus Contendobacter odensis Run_B_J11 TaxID=1400861 RepID=A0A7U7G9B7_9GAMM|nr:bacteriohemerythrin [Candidatus Contendobacter odensis]MBK8533701.1 hemerythrin family protein [Candidatus Competibacteraceae bacterium]MBK8754076.1 hemerythrin family protein [Candidatus Competibacteraceae bacterium]CDH44072.1 putative Bacteriohemerythrin [Candidatus Contendobacter odensis Run_B_J11]
MALLVWNESLTIDIQSMDFQHKHWIRLINELHEAMLQGKGSQVIDQTLDNALGYARLHFAAEERLLSESGYPTYEQHKKLHGHFVDKILRLKNRLNEGHTVLAMELITEMRAWLTQHIQQVDRQYAPFLKQKGVA